MVTYPLATTVASLEISLAGIASQPASDPGTFNLMDGGVMMYPILICAALVVGLAIWNATRLWGSSVEIGPRTRGGIDSLLFWGGFSAVLGVLGTLVGIMVAAQAVERAGEVHATLVWGGIRVALITTVTGVLILSLAGLLWFVLRLRYRKLAAG